MQLKTVLLLPFFFVLAISCKKKSEDTPLAEVPERLEISPATTSLFKGASVNLTLTYFNKFGLPSNLPAGIVWSSNNSNVATVSNLGVVSGANAGQAQIKAVYKSVEALSFVSVVADTNQLAKVSISQGSRIEIIRGQSVGLVANGQTITGNNISGLNFSWNSSNPDIAEVDANGLVLAKSYGTSFISAGSMGISSPVTMVQVIRQGNFSGKGSGGSAKLKIENNILRLETSADFISASSPPDLRLYLSNSSQNVNGATEIATIGQRTGAQGWNVPGSVTVSQYKYIVIWCKQYSVYYGVADLGN